MSYRRALLIGLLITIVALAAGAEELILCGGDEVFVLNLPPPIERPPTKKWSWRARDCAELPAYLREAFKTTDDCKPIDGGRTILITSSGGAVALVERKTGIALFYAAAINAHSADILPGGRVAVASSVGKNGNRLILFDLKWPEKPLYSDPLVSAHGVVWDGDRDILWALGGDELRAYRLVDWETDRPSLTQDAAFPLPGRGGHELSPVPGTPMLMITAGRRVYEFHRETRTFRVYPDLDGRESIKSISIHPLTGQVAYTMSGSEGWWTDRVRFLHPENDLVLPGERLYKARWNCTLHPPASAKGRVIGSILPKTGDAPSVSSRQSENP